MSRLEPEIAVGDRREGARGAVYEVVDVFWSNRRGGLTVHAVNTRTKRHAYRLLRDFERLTIPVDGNADGVPEDDKRG